MIVGESKKNFKTIVLILFKQLSISQKQDIMRKEQVHKKNKGTFSNY